jgi:hypothetical protein
MYDNRIGWNYGRSNVIQVSKLLFLYQAGRWYDNDVLKIDINYVKFIKRIIVGVKFMFYWKKDSNTLCAPNYQI